MIVELGAQVLQVACQQISRWRAEGWRVSHVAVNASVFQLRESTFIATVERCLAAAALQGHDLQIELTESSLATGDTAVLDNLLKLRELGVSIAMDDFGTGYSSLASLRDLPIDVLKIDRSFVIRSSEVEADRALLGGVVGLAHVLGKTVVAEGVETLEQLGLLKELGCDVVQGYLIGKPLRPEEAALLLTRAAPEPVAEEHLSAKRA